MKKEMVIFTIVALVVGLIIGGILFSQTKLIDNTKCQSDLIKCNQSYESYKNIQTFNIGLDFMGAIGNEINGFGDGWIDEKDCIGKSPDYFAGQKAKSCKINSVQLSFGSEPNPFKSKSAGEFSGTPAIFGNGGVFTAECSCEF